MLFSILTIRKIIHRHHHQSQSRAQTERIEFSPYYFLLLRLNTCTLRIFTVTFLLAMLRDDARHPYLRMD